MPEYKAVRPCWHKKVYYKEGDSAFFTNEEVAKKTVPRHFIPAPSYSVDVVKKLAADEKEKKVKIRAQKAEEALK